MALWTWFAAAAVAAFVMEMFAGTFYLLVFAAALAGAAVAAAFGVGISGCLLITALLSAAGTAYVYRLHRQRSPYADSSNDLDIGAQLVLADNLSEHVWRVHYRGTLWEARDVSGSLKTGDNAVVVGKEGIVLLVSPCESQAKANRSEQTPA